MTRAKGLSGRPMTPREEIGYSRDVEHIERLQKALARDMRFSVKELRVMSKAAHTLIEHLRRYLKGRRT